MENSSAPAIETHPGRPAASEMGAWTVHTNSGEKNWNAHSSEIVVLSAGIIPTQETYVPLQSVYDYFNRHLCENKLPNCLITLQRQRGSYGYFAGDRFGREDGCRTDEIALNPAHFRNRKVEETLSTLLHEMKHLEQHHFGKPGRGGYHNKQWAGMMKAVGLIPSNTGKEGGKETGDRVSHYIEPGGRFQRAVEQLLAGGFDITWREIAVAGASSGGGDGSAGRELVSRSGRRTKFTCPRADCKLNAWARPGARLLCGEHRMPMEPAIEAPESAPPCTEPLSGAEDASPAPSLPHAGAGAGAGAGVSGHGEMFQTVMAGRNWLAGGQ